MSYRESLHSDFLAMISGVGSIAAWQDQLDWTLRIVATLVAIVAGSIAIYQRLRKRGYTTPKQD